MAERRNKLYQCLWCVHRKEKVYVEAKYRVMSHIMKHHLSLDEVPHYCKLCLFRCFKRADLEAHVTTYSKHPLLLRLRGLSDTSAMLVSNDKYYNIGDKDLAPLTAEEVQQYMDSKNKNVDLVGQAIHQVFPAGIPTPEPAATTLQLTNPLISQLTQILGAAAATIKQSTPTHPESQVQGQVSPFPGRPVQVTVPATVAPMVTEHAPSPSLSLPAPPEVPRSATRASASNPVTPIQKIKPILGRIQTATDILDDLPDTGFSIQDDLDYDDYLEQGSVGLTATPTLDERPAALLQPQPTAPAKEIATVPEEMRTLLQGVKDSVDANTRALQSQQEQLCQLAKVVMDLSNTLVQCRENPKRPAYDQNPNEVKRRRDDNDYRYRRDHYRERR